MSSFASAKYRFIRRCRRLSLSAILSMPNHLADAISPYLLQHANQPVDWHSWGKTALQKAQDEDKPILLSIGYSACHWCHVMAHESFDDPDIAEIMNAHFINIKVDREERPILTRSINVLTRS